MIKSRLCDLIGIKYPIIQAGMGPFSNNNLCVASANAGRAGTAFHQRSVQQGGSALDLQRVCGERRGQPRMTIWPQCWKRS